VGKRSYLHNVASRARADMPVLRPPRSIGPSRHVEPVESVEAAPVATRRPALAQPPKNEVAAPQGMGMPYAPPTIAAPHARVETRLEPAAPALPRLTPPDESAKGAQVSQPNPKQPAQDAPIVASPRAEGRAPVENPDPLLAANAALRSALLWVSGPESAPRDANPGKPTHDKPILDGPPEERAMNVRSTNVVKVFNTATMPGGEHEPPGEKPPARSIEAPRARALHIRSIEVHIEAPPRPASPAPTIRREARRPASNAVGAGEARLSREFTSTIGLRQG